MTGLPVSRRQALFIAAALAVVLFMAGKLLLGSGTSHTAAPALPLPVSTTPSQAATRLVVDVVGAVRRPGLYRLGDGTRIADAVARAGGATAKANLDGVNLAAPLADGEQVVVPAKITGPGGAVSAPGGAAAPAQVSLSTATLEQLDTLPGVGPVTAQKILDYRAAHGAFRSVDELDAIPGIGPARLDGLRDMVVP